jgi:hypothetical protein
MIDTPRFPENSLK